MALCGCHSWEEALTDAGKHKIYLDQPKEITGFPWELQELHFPAVFFGVVTSLRSAVLMLHTSPLNGAA